MPMIQGVMEEAGLAWADLALIGVTVGPGAFTGIRIGLAAARGMALAGGFAIAGVGSCEAVAHAVPAEERRGRSLLVAIDSKRSDLFFQTFDAALAPSGGRLSPRRRTRPSGGIPGLCCWLATRRRKFSPSPPGRACRRHRQRPMRGSWPAWR